MSKKPERFESAYWEVEEDEESGKHFWTGSCAGDMDGTRFDGDESLIMDPSHFPVGTRVNVSEPEDEAFYEKLWANR